MLHRGLFLNLHCGGIGSIYESVSPFSWKKDLVLLEIVLCSLMHYIEAYCEFVIVVILKFLGNLLAVYVCGMLFNYSFPAAGWNRLIEFEY